MSDPSTLARATGLIVVVLGITTLLALAVMLWRTRGTGDMARREISDLLEQLAEDFVALTRAPGCRTSWFLDPPRRSRELRLAKLHGVVDDVGLSQAVADCRSRYLGCWNLAATPTSESERKEELADVARKGADAANDALSLLRRS